MSPNDEMHKVRPRAVWGAALGVKILQNSISSGLRHEETGSCTGLIAPPVNSVTEEAEAGGFQVQG